MEINKNSWHYKVWAWSHSGTDGSGTIPEQSNLCSYVRELFIRVPLILFALALVIITMGVLIVVPLNIAALPFGFYFRHPIVQDLRGRGGEDHMVRYQGLKIGNFVLLPWHVLLPALVVLTVWWDYRSVQRHEFANFPFLLSIAALFTGVVCGAIYLYSNSQTSKLAREYVSAKTKGICPLITFKDDK